MHTSDKARLTSVAISVPPAGASVRGRLQNLTICSLARCKPSLKISWKSVWKFLSKVANRQTDRQTNKQRREDNLLGGGNYEEIRLSSKITVYSLSKGSKTQQIFLLFCHGTSTDASRPIINLVRHLQVITLSIHFCLQHINRDAFRRAIRLWQLKIVLFYAEMF